MFQEIFTQFVSIVGEGCTKKLIRVSTDGAANMVRTLLRALSRIQNITLSGLYRVWCGAHQLNLGVQDVFRSTGKERFQRLFYQLISYFRRQKNIISEMR